MVSKIVKHTTLALVALAIVVPAALLVSGVLPYKVLAVRTGSMSPTIPPKSAVIVREGAYRVGQVISYRTQDGIVTHRLIRRKADGSLVTKGDANRTVDPSSVLPANVIGGVVAAPRMLGYWLVYLKNPAGLASVFMTILCLWLIYSITMDCAKPKRPVLGEERPRTSLTEKTAVASATPMSYLRPESMAAVPSAIPEGTEKGIRDQIAVFDETTCEGDQRARSEAGTGSTPEQSPAPKVWQSPVILQCSRCGATFLQANDLRAHVAEHSDRRSSHRYPGFSMWDVDVGALIVAADPSRPAREESRSTAGRDRSRLRR